MGLKMHGSKENDSGMVVSGPMCPINPSPSGVKASQGGAVTSAFLSAFL
ncbi:MAG: hypothetical protein HZB33_12555 [Nitrospirae bacterium]|nr:hypothetical protein [Nitrospirota bacterium]